MDLRQSANFGVCNPKAYLPTAGDRWYAAQTLALREQIAVGHLGAQGFRVFLPQQMRTVKHARKLLKVRRAVFPGYVFVTFNPERDRWRSINGTVGVSRLVMAGDRPLPVPRGVVEKLIDCVDENGLCHLDAGLVPGQPVRVISGPLAELIGKLASLDDKGRVRVLLEIMGGEVVTTLDRSALEAV